MSTGHNALTTTLSFNITWGRWNIHTPHRKVTNFPKIMCAENVFKWNSQ